MPVGHTTRKVAVRQAVEAQVLAEVAQKAKVTAQGVLAEIALLSNVSIKDYVNPDGSWKALSELTREQAACIASVELLRKNVEAGDGHIDTVLKFKLWDKLKALEMLAKHFSLLVERLDISGTVEIKNQLRARLEGARKRLVSK